MQLDTVICNGNFFFNYQTKSEVIFVNFTNIGKLCTCACAPPPPLEIEKQKKGHQSKFKAISPIFCQFFSRKYHFLCYFFELGPP